MNRKVVKISILLISVVFLAASCNRQQETDNQNQTATAASEENKKELEAYQKKMEPICKQNILELTGIEVAKCKDLEESLEFYEFLFSESLIDFSYLPAFCERKVSQMSGEEFIECLQPESSEDDDNPFSDD